MTRIPIVVAVWLAPITAFAAARATLQPGTDLAIGVPAQLSITVDGKDARPPSPQIPGATVRMSGQASQTQIINGATSAQTTYMYTIVPNQLGALEIPAISVSTASGVESTEPLHARVAAAPRAVVPPASAATTGDAHAFVTLDVPVKSLVVGQAVPIKIRAYFRGGTSATLEGAPRVTSDAFTLSGMSDKPTQTQLEIRGEPYLQATWTAILSPAKPTTATLGVELPVEIAYRSEPRPEPPQRHDATDPFDALFGGDPFGDLDDLDSMFDIGQMQRYDTTLRASAGKLVVTDPPERGKPAGFAGAVGHFDLALAPPTEEPRVGEPLTLSIRVTGTGNFDRVAIAGVPDFTGLRAYSIKSVYARGPTPLSGTKTFTQSVVPTRAGVLAIPALELAFFDPDKHAYVTAGTAPITLDVAAARGGGASDPGLAASVRDPAMTPNRLDPGSTRASLQPQYAQRRFWWIPIGLVAITAALVLIARSRKSPRIAHLLRGRRVDRAIDRASSEMTRAVRAHDRAAFFIAARSALQARLAASWSTPPEAITAHDVATHLGPRGDSIRAVFERADGISYGGDTATPDSLEHWQTIVHTELRALETAS